MNPPSEAMLLRLAVQQLANGPQAQRRYVQLGIMARAVGNLERLGADPRGVDGGEMFSDEAAAAIARLREHLLAKSQAEPRLFAAFDEQVCGPREFLWSDALVDDDWEELRQLARRCYREIADDSVFVALMAK